VASARPFQIVGRVGQALKLLQHEARRHHLALDETGASDVRDAPVNDDAVVEEHHLTAVLPGAIPVFTEHDPLERAIRV